MHGELQHSSPGDLFTSARSCLFNGCSILMPKPPKQKGPTLPWDWCFPSQNQTCKSTSVQAPRWSQHTRGGAFTHTAPSPPFPQEESTPVTPSSLLPEAQPQWSTANRVMLFLKTKKLTKHHVEFLKMDSKSTKRTSSLLREKSSHQMPFTNQRQIRWSSVASGTFTFFRLWSFGQTTSIYLALILGQELGMLQ